MSSALVCVAGATGNAGAEIVRALAQRGCKVRALVRDPGRLGSLRTQCDEIRRVEVTRRATLRGALDGATMLISAIGKTRQRDAIERRAVDVQANWDLFAEARRAGVERIGFVSVFGARADHPAVLSRYKAEAEDGLRGTGVPHVIFRPTGFFTDLWRALEAARGGTFWTLGGADPRFNPIDVADLGAFVAERMLATDGVRESHAPVGGPDSYRLSELRPLFERVLGRRLQARKLPGALLRAGLGVLRVVREDTWEVAQSLITTFGGREDLVAPPFGTVHLEDYLRARWAAEPASGSAGLA